MKLGRNEPCPCGSGLKYKRCCLEKDRMASISDLGARDAEGRPIGRPEIDALYEGRRVRAVGSSITFRPPEETKQEFFVHVLTRTVMETLEDDWKAKQDTLPEAERHPLALWTDAWDETRRDHGAKARDLRDEGRDQYSATATGDAMALVTLAYDVYMLRHAMAIDAGHPLIKRLGQRAQFQGARYEIAAAAIFVRAGYRIEWLTDTSRKLPEFIARSDGSDLEIAVEAKSRPRPGLLGQAGERPSEESVSADLARLLRNALEKETDGRPYVVFLDMNLPPGQDKTFPRVGADPARGRPRVARRFVGGESRSVQRRRPHELLVALARRRGRGIGRVFYGPAAPRGDSVAGFGERPHLGGDQRLRPAAGGLTAARRCRNR